MKGHLHHDDVIKWKHFKRYRPFVRGIHRWPVNSPHKGQWRGALMFSLICAWTNGWVNNREARCLRRHRAHYVAIVIFFIKMYQHVADHHLNGLYYNMPFDYPIDMTHPWHGNIFHITGSLCLESTGHRWVSHTKACHEKPLRFLCC